MTWPCVQGRIARYMAVCEGADRSLHGRAQGRIAHDMAVCEGADRS